jgi:hypothetical protein
MFKLILKYLIILLLLTSLNIIFHISLAVKKEGEARSRVKATNLGESDTTIDIHNNMQIEEVSESMEDVVQFGEKNLGVQSDENLYTSRE